MPKNFEQLAERLGVELGPLTKALMQLSLPEENPAQVGTVVERSPSWGCDFYLDFPEPFPHITPTNVLLFGSTGVDCNQFGFVEPTEPIQDTDELVVALVRPKGDEVIALPDLATFLSLVAMAGTEAIDPSLKDEDFTACRTRALEDPLFRETSLRLCTLPGVSLPANPSELLEQCAEVVFHVDQAPPRIVSLSAAREHLEAGERAQAAEVLVLLADKFLGLGDLVPDANWQALGELLGRVDPKLSKQARAALRARGIG